MAIFTQLPPRPYAHKGAPEPETYYSGRYILNAMMSGHMAKLQAYHKQDKTVKPLTPSDKLVLCALACHANKKTRLARPSIDGMAKRLKLGASTVAEGLWRLEDSGAIIRRKMRGTSLYYIVPFAGEDTDLSFFSDPEDGEGQLQQALELAEQQGRQRQQQAPIDFEHHPDDLDGNGEEDLVDPYLEDLDFGLIPPQNLEVIDTDSDQDPQNLEKDFSFSGPKQDLDLVDDMSVTPSPSEGTRVHAHVEPSASPEKRHQPSAGIQGGAGLIQALPGDDDVFFDVSEATAPSAPAPTFPSPTPAADRPVDGPGRPSAAPAGSAEGPGASAGKAQLDEDVVVRLRAAAAACPSGAQLKLGVFAKFDSAMVRHALDVFDHRRKLGLPIKTHLGFIHDEAKRDQVDLQQHLDLKHGAVNRPPADLRAYRAGHGEVVPARLVGEAVIEVGGGVLPPHRWKYVSWIVDELEVDDDQVDAGAAAAPGSVPIAAPAPVDAGGDGNGPGRLKRAKLSGLAGRPEAAGGDEAFIRRQLGILRLSWEDWTAYQAEVAAAAAATVGQAEHQVDAPPAPAAVDWDAERAGETAGALEVRA